MTDPLNDERFPDRPNTQDFWRLSESVLANDAAATEHDLEHAIGSLIDVESVVYMAAQRIGMAGMPGDPVALAVWLDGLALGIKFQQAGGHREDT